MNNSNLKIKEMKSYGRKGRRGNLLGIEPFLVPEDYASAENFQSKLDGYLSVARDRGWINERTIILWPEYIGTWLVFNGETPSPTLQGMMLNMIQAHQLEFWSFYAAATEQNKVYAALFRTKAGAMAETYQAVFSGLSKKYAVTTIAGSIVLPSPQFIGGKLVFDVNALLYNLCAVFDPNGNPYPEIVYKAYPTSGELPYTAPAPAGDLPVFDTSSGRVGVLICADSWYPQAYARMKEANAEILAVPSFGHGGLKAWKETWKGYDGWPNPPDVNPKDVDKITNSKAWLKYSLVGRIGGSNAYAGSNIFLHGDLWPDLDAGGGVAVVVSKGDKWKRENKTDYATLNNLWL